MTRSRSLGGATVAAAINTDWECSTSEIQRIHQQTTAPFQFLDSRRWVLQRTFRWPPPDCPVSPWPPRQPPGSTPSAPWRHARSGQIWWSSRYRRTNSIHTGKQPITDNSIDPLNGTTLHFCLWQMNEATISLMILAHITHKATNDIVLIFIYIRGVNRVARSAEKNKKAQLSLTNPRDAKACQNCSNSTCLQRCRWQYWPIIIIIIIKCTFI